MKKIISFVAALFAALTLGAGFAGNATAVTVPTLGHRAGIFAHGSEGFGLVKPRTVFNGGDPTGLVTHITWKHWGKPYATGNGTGWYVGPNHSVANGHEERAHIVVFRLGTCHGKRMYRAVEWYFPRHGQHFRPKTYEDICNGTYVINGRTF